MSYYKTCPYCGAHLDPGEVCDCTKKTAADAANIDDGITEIKTQNDSTPIVQGGEGSCQV